MNSLSKYSLWFLAIVLSALVTQLEAVENKAYLKNGQIVVETEEGLRTIGNKTKKGYTGTTSQWNIDEEVSPVDEALAVYNSKSDPLYNHKIHYYSKSDGDIEYFIEYTSDDEDSRYLLSPQGDHIYYLGLNSEGQRHVYGHNLLANTKTAIASGNNFHIVTCTGESSFVVVQKNQNGLYDVFDAEGKKINTISQPGVFREIEDKIKNLICI